LSRTISTVICLRGCVPAAGSALYLLAATPAGVSQGMVQPLRAADVPAAIALLERVGLPSGAANLARYLRWQPAGAWGVVEHGALVGGRPRFEG